MSADPKLVPVLKKTIQDICAPGGYLNAWPELMSIFADILARKDYAVSLPFYHLIKKIIKRYHVETKSYDLFEEIKLTIKQIAHIFTEDAIQCTNFLYSQDKDKKEVAIPYMKMFHYIQKIFYSINYQDFPELFEDNLKTWIEILQAGIDFTIPVNDEETLKQVIKLKCAVMKNINLYHNNYSEDIQDYTNSFEPLMWKLVQFVGNDERYSKLVKEVMEYYKIAFQYGRGNHFSAENVNHLISFLIVPNMQMTRTEMDSFEDSPVDFIKVELEEVDLDSSKQNELNLCNFR